jgi:hypothetical protein
MDRFLVLAAELFSIGKDMIEAFLAFMGAA